MSQSQPIREAIKCPDKSTGHSLSASSFLQLPPNSFSLSGPYLPSFSLVSIKQPLSLFLHLPYSPQISVNEDISHGSKHSPLLRPIWQPWQ